MNEVAEILVVDDEVAIRQVFARMLTEQGYRVQTAADATTALAMIDQGSFAAVISDIRMPGMSGIDLARELRARKIDVPIIVVTGNPGLETAIEAMEHGILRYLRKPVEARDLARVTREVIRLHDLARAEQLAIDNASLRSLVEELTRARDAAKAASRAKSAFLATMSHELRTPIAAVLGYTDLVLDGELGAEDRENLNQVRASAASLLGTVGDLLTLADLVGGDTQLTPISFDARAVVADIVARFEPVAHAKGLALRLELEESIPETLRGDAKKLAQIFEHLVRNAIKFTTRGEVTVRLGLERASERLVGLRVSIADTGVGIPPEARVRVCEAFAQADDSSSRRFGGAGLGLAISSALARLLGGGLEIESTVGAGTTVQVTAPFERCLAA